LIIETIKTRQNPLILTGTTQNLIPTTNSSLFMMPEARNRLPGLLQVFQECVSVRLYGVNEKSKTYSLPPIHGRWSFKVLISVNLQIFSLQLYSTTATQQKAVRQTLYKENF
jgi:hypothetical protein